MNTTQLEKRTHILRKLLTAHLRSLIIDAV